MGDTRERERMASYNCALPPINIISDSVGATAISIARAAASQFGETEPSFEVLPNVRTFQVVEAFLEKRMAEAMAQTGRPDIVLFYTIVEDEVKRALGVYLAFHPEIRAVDLMTKPVESIASVTGCKPMVVPGELHITDEHYFNRIEAIEFTIAHDDGRNPQDLTNADIVLLGVSRCGKTPTSIYLAQEGYRVSNVPLDLVSDPPAEIFKVDPSRLFGLVTTAEVLTDIRKRRLGNALAIAGDYADREKVEQDLEKARALMRKLGCLVIHTENRAVEETAQEILRYYEIAHPRKRELRRGSDF